MKAFSTFSIALTLLALTACGSDKGYDVEGKWGYRERIAEQARANGRAPARPVVSAKTQDQTQYQPAPPAKDTVPCETTLSADGCGASPHGQKAAEIRVNQ